MAPVYTSGERIADAVIHVLGVTAGLVAVTAMLAAAVAYLPPGSTATLAIYGAAMLAMLGFSAAYHLAQASRWQGLLRRLDHAAIFLKIAGTYTPFALLKIGGAGGYALLLSVWSVALLGAAGKLLLASTWDRVAIPLYLALGWAGVVMLPPLAGSVTLITLVLLAVGGSLYSIGVIFHVWRSLPYQNAIWHLFVLAGTGCHFGAVTTAAFT
ncbi:MAG: PAQR family membrane homeostasis protein TrhA [Bacteroidota bacterium]|jgi:hemolysin III